MYSGTNWKWTKLSPLIFSSIFTFFGKKPHGWTQNAETRPKTPSELYGGYYIKSWFFCMRFSVKSVSIGKLYFAIWSGSIQSPYNLADRFKIHTIVRFDTWNIRLHLPDPISGGHAVKPAVQKANNKWSVPCTFREIAIFTCFWVVLYKGSMEGVWLGNANLLPAISVSGRLFARRGNFLKKRKGLTTYYALFGQLASRRVRRI